jgi:hypothetical protein
VRLQDLGGRAVDDASPQHVRHEAVGPIEPPDQRDHPLCDLLLSGPFDAIGVVGGAHAAALFVGVGGNTFEVNDEAALIIAT